MRHTSMGVAAKYSSLIAVSAACAWSALSATAAQPWPTGTDYNWPQLGPSTSDEGAICDDSGHQIASEYHGLSEDDDDWANSWGQFPCDMQGTGIGDCCEYFGAYLSRCYANAYEPSDGSIPAEPWYGDIGFARGIDLGWGVGPGDYPPISTNVHASTSPLVPAGSPQVEGRYYPERPAVGELDLITGQPLVREVDLELPFGGAVYRQVRTYSEHPTVGYSSVGDGFRSPTLDRTYWDWYGQGWVAGENPLFLFDAAWLGVVSAADALNTDGSPPRCYFLPDAHHAIPFEQVELGPGQVAYIAPPQFDAVLLHSGGTWDSLNTTWITPPSEFKVLLHNRSVIYTIRPYYEDYPPSQHAAPYWDPQASMPVGRGAPYYGLVTSIEDRAGNTVKMTYADGHAPRERDPADQNTAGCLECEQKCHLKGMIERVQLFAAGQTDPAWTLLYTYRAFTQGNKGLVSGDDADDLDYWGHESFAPMVHSVLVYEGSTFVAQDVTRDLILPTHAIDENTIEPFFIFAAPDTDETINNQYSVIVARPLEAVGDPSLPPTPLDWQDDVIGPTAHGGDPQGWANVPSDWSHVLRYSYSEPECYGEYTASNGVDTVVYSNAEDYYRYAAGSIPLYDTGWAPRQARFRDRMAPYLVKAAVSTAVDPEDLMQGMDTRYWLYRYQETDYTRLASGSHTPSGYIHTPYFGTLDIARFVHRRLKAALRPDTVGRLVEARPDHQVGVNAYVNSLVGRADWDELPVREQDPQTGQTQIMNRSLWSLFDTSLLQWNQPYRFNDAAGSGAYPNAAYPISWAAYHSDSNGVSPFRERLRNAYFGAGTPSETLAFEDDCGSIAPYQTGFLPDGAALYCGVGPDDSKRVYRVYRYIRVPDGETYPAGNPNSWRQMSTADLEYEGNPIIGANPGPEVVIESANMLETSVSRSIYHHPFRFTSTQYDGIYLDPSITLTNESARAQTIPLGMPMWFTVIDEYESIEDAVLKNSIEPGRGIDYANPEPWISRRVVSMNPAGLVLTDRTWSGGGFEENSPHLAEAYKYDEWGRLIERRTLGWAAAATDDPDTGVDAGEEGLCYRYVYSDQTPFDPDEPIKEIGTEVAELWLKRGSADPGGGVEGDVLLNKLSYFEAADGAEDDELFRDGLLEQVSQYDYARERVGANDYRYEFHNWNAADHDANGSGTPDADEKPPLERKISAGPRYLKESNGSLYRSFVREDYDTEGKLVWRSYGSMQDPFGSPDPDDEIFIDYTGYDSQGRVNIEIVDLDTAGVGNFKPPNLIIDSGTVQDDFADYAAFRQPILNAVGMLDGLARKAEAPPLQETTFREYGQFGPTKVVHPDGRRDVIKYSFSSQRLQELRAMGVEFDGTDWTFLSPGWMSDFSGASYVKSQLALLEQLNSGEWNGDPAELDKVFSNGGLQIVAEVEPGYDTSGRLSGVSVTNPEQPGEQLASSVFMDAYGSVIRERTADGQVTRNKHDLLGRLHKTFRGTTDLHHQWGTADVGQDNDDMLLVEKLHYGRGVHDAGEVSRRWMFSEISQNDDQYDADFSEPSEGNNPGFIGVAYSAEQDSATGQGEVYAHDWRMRRIHTDIERIADPDSPELHRSVRTWMDNQDRVRLRAVFAGPTPSGVPDADVLPEDVALSSNGEADYWNTTIGAILSAGIAPVDGVALISLDETIYNDAGQVQEQRRYDVSSSYPQWLATRSWYNHQGKPVRTEAPNGDVTQSVYDAKGRLVRSVVLAGSLEIVRTENSYGPLGTLDAVQTWERLDGAPAMPEELDALGDEYKTLSTTFNWYNSNGRLIATADLGSWAEDGSLEAERDPAAQPGVQGGVLGFRPDTPPVILDDLILVAADEGGAGDEDDIPEKSREVLVGFSYPEEFEFDGFGRARAQIRCYAYDARGNMAATLSVRSCVDTSGGSGTPVLAQEYLVTRSYHDAYGRLVLTVEDGYTGDGTLAGVTYLGRQRATAYRYDGSRVTDIAAVLGGHQLTEFAYEDDPETPNDESAEPTGEWRADWSATDGTLQVTHIMYGAPVVSPRITMAQAVAHFKTDNPALHPYVSEPGVVISHRTDLPLAVWYPDPATGEYDSQAFPDLRFTYFADGKVATRADARGVVFLYSYDDDGNLTRVRVDDTGLPILGLVTSDESRPHNRIEFDHDERGAMTRATTYRQDGLDAPPGGTVQTESEFAYDVWGALLYEAQSREGSVDASTPTVSYAWEVDTLASGDDSGNFARLSSITYPDRGSMGTWGGSGPVPGRTVTYGYGASGSVDDLLSRVRTLTASGGPAGGEIGHVATYSYHGRSRLIGTLLGSVECAPGTLIEALRDTRSLDAFGRVRTHEIASFDDSSTCASPVYGQIHRYEHGYDEGGSRRHTRVTQRDIGASSRDNVHSAVYTLDPLGRLLDAEVGALDTSTYETTLPAFRRERFGYGLDSVGNRIGAGSAYGFEHALDPDGLSGWQQIVAQRDDTVNARNEVTAITGVGEPTVTLTRDEIGSLSSDSDGLQGYYDAWGRLGVWSHVDFAASPPSVNAGFYQYDALGRLCKRSAPWPTQPSLSRVETYYHDGVRRIQAVFTDPVHAETPWADPFGTPPPAQTPQTRMEREYIWAAHETAGVNELHVAIDWFDREAWPIQDVHNQTVMGYTDAVGDLVEQRVYTPFGQILNADKTALANPGGLYNDFRLRLGHHGLFADRLDADTTQPVLRHADARVICLTDNRVYEPLRGSWMQRDPNGTGALTLDTLQRGGSLFSPALSSHNVHTNYADGLNIFAAYQGNAVASSDPTGLLSYLSVQAGGTGAAALGIGGTALQGAGAIMLAKDIVRATQGEQSWLAIAADVILTVSGGKLLDLAVDGIRALRAARSARRATPSTATGPANRAFATAVEESVRKIYGGKETVLRTSRGGRKIDSLSPDGLAIEVKTGYQSLAKVKEQVLKDIELLKAGREVRRVEWHFFQGRTQNFGADDALLNMLRENGIVVRMLDTIPTP